MWMNKSQQLKIVIRGLYLMSWTSWTGLDLTCARTSWHGESLSVRGLWIFSIWLKTGSCQNNLIKKDRFLNNFKIWLSQLKWGTLDYVKYIFKQFFKSCFWLQTLFITFIHVKSTLPDQNSNCSCVKTTQADRFRLGKQACLQMCRIHLRWISLMFLCFAVGQNKIQTWAHFYNVAVEL